MDRDLAACQRRTDAAPDDTQQFMLRAQLLIRTDRFDDFLALYQRANPAQCELLEVMLKQHKIPLEAVRTPIEFQELAREAPVLVFTALMSLLSGGQKPLLKRMIRSLKRPHSEFEERISRPKGSSDES
jgi:hypothetical protein